MSVPSFEFSRALVQLEDRAGWDGCIHDPGATPDQRIQLSIAISLRRIADALDGTTLGVDVSDSVVGHHYRNL